MSDLNPAQFSFQQVADLVPVMIWMSGLDAGCFYFNRAWLDYRGRTLEQEYGNGWAEGVHPNDLEPCVAHYLNCFENRVPFAMNYRLRHHSGAYFWILDRGAPHYSATGQFLGFFGGCAETDAVAPATLNAQLRVGLAGVETFARDFAASRLLESDAVQRGSRGRDALETEHARREIRKLADDMVRYRDIPHGACLT